jgi:hypothetical protein
MACSGSVRSIGLAPNPTSRREPEGRCASASRHRPGERVAIVRQGELLPDEALADRSVGAVVTRRSAPRPAPRQSTTRRSLRRGTSCPSCGPMARRSAGSRPRYGQSRAASTRGGRRPAARTRPGHAGVAVPLRGWRGARMRLPCLWAARACSAMSRRRPCPERYGRTEPAQPSASRRAPSVGRAERPASDGFEGGRSGIPRGRHIWPLRPARHRARTPRSSPTPGARRRAI